LLGYWGTVGLIVFGFLSGKVSATELAVRVTQGTLVVWFFVMVIFCIWRLQRGHALNKAFLRYYMDCIEGVPDAKRPVRTDVPLDLTWMAGQILFSLMLTLLAIILVGSAAKVADFRMESLVSAW